MDRNKSLETCLVIVTGLLFVYLIKDWYPLLILALIIGIIGAFLSKPASWITLIWYKIGDLLGKIVSKIILSLIFYVFLLPISLLSKLFNKKNPNINNKRVDSMWINREYFYSKEDLKKPW
jgi:hypothetical protein